MRQEKGIVTTKSSPAAPVSERVRRPSAPDLRCTGIGSGFGGMPVLDRLDLHVPAGTVTALLGASGCGKSTLVKHVLGLASPDEGSVMIGGLDVWGSTPEQLLEIHRNLSVLHGGPTVYEGSVFASLTVRENLLVRLYEKQANPSLASGGSTRRHAASNPFVTLWRYVASREAPPEMVRHAQDWLDRFGLAEHADQLPHEVSAGQRRRMALAATLAVDAPLYILDDFDGAIDTITRDVIVDAVRSTHERIGATMLIATHDAELAGAVADRIAVLACGRIVFDGPPGEAISGLSRWYRQADDLVESRAVVPAARPPSEPIERAGLTGELTGALPAAGSPMAGESRSVSVAGPGMARPEDRVLAWSVLGCAGLVLVFYVVMVVHALWGH